jgi:diadenosine tetraphosphate (Ap4A) HIT family hydrolase
MDDMPGCLACDLTAVRRPLPGGLIHETGCWRVEHCIRSLGVGTLLVKPKRRVTRVSDLSAEEAVEQGPLLRRCAIVVDRLLEPQQTYVCLWSHAGANRFTSTTWSSRSSERRSTVLPFPGSARRALSNVR